MRPNDAFLFRFGENIHHSPIALGPIAFGEAVHEADIQIVGSQFPAETVKIGASVAGSRAQVLVRS